MISRGPRAETPGQSIEKRGEDSYGHFLLPIETLPEQEQKHEPWSVGVDFPSPALGPSAVLDPLPSPPLFLPPLMERKSDMKRKSFGAVSAR
jgi:hypothetical protein